MPFRVTPTGVIECDSVDEAIELQHRLTLQQGFKATVKRTTQSNGAPSGDGGSNRDKVIAVIKQDWATVHRIVAETGLDIKRVRGVVNAPGLTDKIERRTAEDGKEYRWKQEA